MQQTIAELQAEATCTILIDEPMANHTTWKIGGPADLMIIPKDKEALARTVRILHSHRIPWVIVGKGSNMLVTDKGIRGAAIKLGDAFESVRFENNLIYAGGAFGLIKLSVLAGKEGLTGLEFAGGIPGSVGGAVYMNAGAQGSDMSRILKQADIVLDDGELVTWTKDELQFAYRHSLLHHRKGIVTEAVFELEFGDRKEIAAAMATYKDRRLRTQPLQLPSAGSTFRNPENHYAAKLIEEAGLKGFKVGGAEISTQHANFIINTGHATARDVLTLIDTVRRTVKETYGVELVPEVLVVGER
jgi:UDP-N-acetylmuramate dehydrogenase